MTLRILHNPRCSKSRKTLELLEQRGVQPEITHYLEEPPSATEVLRMARLLTVPVSSLVRQSDDDFKTSGKELDLSDDEALASWLAGHPRALQRPIVIDDDNHRAVIGRPPENVLELLSA